MDSGQKSIHTFIIAYKRDYARVRQLLDVESKNDPPDNRMGSIYEAREIMNKLCLKLRSKINNVPADKNLPLKKLLGSSLLHLVSINMITEHFNESTLLLNEAVELLSAPNKSETTTTLINIYNNLAMLCLDRHMPDKAKPLLQSATKLYLLCKNHIHRFYGYMDSPTSFGQFIAESLKGIEEAHTVTLYALANAFEQLDSTFQCAVFTHVALKRQLSLGDLTDPIYWVRKSLRVSQYFIQHDGFYQARHHLIAASAVLGNFIKKLKAGGTDDVSRGKLKMCKETSANIAMNWAKYCTALLTGSRKRLEEFDDLDSAGYNNDMSTFAFDDYEFMCRGDIRSLVFHYLDVSEYQTKIGDTFLTDYLNVKFVYQRSLEWLNKAKKFYTKDTFPENYIQLEHDRSQLYNNVAFFAEAQEEKLKMQERRVILIETLFEEINLELYVPQCRQLRFELAKAYYDILELKPPNTAELDVEEINVICENIWNNFELFLNTFKDQNGQMPTKFSGHHIVNVIEAHAKMARSSVMSIGSNDLEKHCRRTCQGFNAVVTLCKTHTGMEEYCKEDYWYAINYFRKYVLHIARIHRRAARNARQ